MANTRKKTPAKKAEPSADSAKRAGRGLRREDTVHIYAGHPETESAPEPAPAKKSSKKSTKKKATPKKTSTKKTAASKKTSAKKAAPKKTSGKKVAKRSSSAAKEGDSKRAGRGLRRENTVHVYAGHPETEAALPAATKKRKRSTKKKATPAKEGAKKTAAEKTPEKKPARARKAPKPAALTPFVFGPASSGSKTPAPHQKARTDVNLTGYQYGSESKSASGKLDIVFCLDCTSSMSGTIAECQKNITKITEDLESSESQDIRFCLIPYRDHMTSEEYCTKVYPFTHDKSQMLKNINEQRAAGGGDLPEAVTAALFEAAMVDWREDAAKLVIFMADAPPHGLMSGSWPTYPDGDPDGKDPIALSKEMAGMGIVVYSVGVNMNDATTRAFFGGLSAITGGQFVSLANASLLSQMILGGARENIAMERQMSTVRRDVAAMKEKDPTMTEEAMAKEVEKAMKKAGATFTKLAPDKTMDVPEEKIQQFRSAKNLAELKTLWSNAPPALGRTLSASKLAVAETKSVSSEAASRMVRMAAAREARSTDKVIVECFKEGSKVRVRVVSEGYDNSKNVQFPKDIRAVGKKFQVDTIVDAGSFYRAKGAITPV